jgi:uncharacterized protein (TIGR02147 family)
MGKEPVRPGIFGYHDPRALLRDLIEYTKQTDTRFSLRTLATRSGIASGFLPMYLSGKRRITLETAQALIKNISLSEKERRFFLLLIELDNSPAGPPRMEILGQLQKLDVYREMNEKEFEVHRYLKSWFYVAIRELSLLPDFKDDAQWIKKRLRTKVPLAEISSAVEFLKDHNFILQHEGKYFQNPEKNLECVDGVYKISLANFHRQMLELAADSIDQLSSQKRVVIGNTIPIRFEDFEKAKKILDDALDEIQKLQSDQGNGDEIYHFELAAFPLTHEMDEDEP